MLKSLSIGVVSAIALLSASGMASAEPVKVVASFSILADMTREIGGDAVEVQPLVGPDGDAHVFQPSPADTRKLADADLVVMNGLGFEGWMPRLVEASGYTGKTVVASTGVTELKSEEHAEHDHEAAHEHKAGHEHEHEHGHEGHDHGPIDPHAWQDLSNGVVYARNIADGLAEADPVNADGYRQRAAAYIAQMQALDAEVKAELATIPQERRKVVTSHDAFGYFARAYGVEFIAPEGVSTESEASAADVAAIISQIKAENITGVFVESITNSRLIEQIARETDAHVGGTLYSDALSDASGPAPTYLDMFRNNTRKILDALKLG
ncbi:metal ABC transporter substrate-binding protein [Aureimonas altamirensis]|uniref:metal ABC transporter substrate-binding protein n=1 Tax=Aureimonas altamirensis TaxID=370622 RepID=UPI001E4899E8|nr:metal ABC transporter substrate-binding protein [Aureimonas altamirensis]UHD45169.1 metal ABC transporter substrate-binding protein [Aureimonas altamirensis]